MSGLRNHLPSSLTHVWLLLAALAIGVCVYLQAPQPVPGMPAWWWAVMSVLVGLSFYLVEVCTCVAGSVVSEGRSQAGKVLWFLLVAGVAIESGFRMARVIGPVGAGAFGLGLAGLLTALGRPVSRCEQE